MNQQVFKDLVKRLEKDLTDFCRLYGISCVINSTIQERFCGQSIDCHLSIPSISQGGLDEGYTYTQMVDIMIEDPEYVDYVYKNFYRTITEYVLDKRYTYVASIYRRHKIQISKPEPLTGIYEAPAQLRYGIRLGNNYSKSILTLEEMDVESLEFLKLVSKATGESLC